MSAVPSEARRILGLLRDKYADDDRIDGLLLDLDSTVFVVTETHGVEWDEDWNISRFEAALTDIERTT